MDELADSSGLAGDPGGLQRRLAADGYLFFRGLLPPGLVRAAGAAVADRLRAGGWLDDRGIPSVTPRAGGPRDALADPAFRAAITGAAFNQIPYLPPLRAVVRHVLGAAGVLLPGQGAARGVPGAPRGPPARAATGTWTTGWPASRTC